MRYNHVNIASMLLIATAVLLPARAANINDLQEEYSGWLHHSSSSGLENQEFYFEFTSTQPNGNFTGSLGGEIPISGKVTGSGVISFSGSRNDKGGLIQIKKGTGQLSATGRFIVGSFQYKGSGVSNPGLYTFHVEEDE
jgi:hypothetical protein